MAARANSRTPADAPPRRIVVNLDTVEKENPVEPMVAIIGDREIEFQDIRDIPWDELQDAMSDADEFIYRTMQPEDYKFLKEQKLPGWKINILMENYLAHFDIKDPRTGRRMRRS